MIFEYIQNLIVKLQEEDKSEISQLTALNLRDLVNIHKDIIPSTMSIGAILFLVRSDMGGISYECELQLLKERNAKVHVAAEELKKMNASEFEKLLHAYLGNNTTKKL